MADAEASARSRGSDQLDHQAGVDLRRTGSARLRMDPDAAETTGPPAGTAGNGAVRRHGLIEAPPVADTRAPGARLRPPDDAAQEAASERATDPQRAQARQRRVAPQRTRAPRRGRREVSAGRSRSDRTKRSEGDKDPRAARATRRQPRRSSRLCRASKGAGSAATETRSDVTTPYALFSCSATACGNERQRVKLAPVANWGNIEEWPSLRPVAKT